VLAGLVENLTLAEIADYFLDDDKRRSIFAPTKDVVDAVISRLLHIGPKYSAAAKLSAIELLMPKTGTKPLKGCVDAVIGPNKLPVHVMVVGFDYDRNRAVFFRSAPANRPGWGDGQPAKVSLAEAVHGSTNAPVNYFDAPATLPLDPARYWDGGVTGCNNPAMAAVVEAMVLGHAPQEVHLLSLGTGTISLPLADFGAPASPFTTPRSEVSLKSDLGKLASAILDDPPDAATFIAHVVTGANTGLAPPVVSRVVRMSPLISPVRDAAGNWKAPANRSPAQFHYLCSVSLEALAPMEIRQIDSYCADWLGDKAPNQPIRSKGAPFDPGAPEIGYGRFSEAFTAWQSLFPLLRADGPALA
jgi:hypothetical protein